MYGKTIAPYVNHILNYLEIHPEGRQLFVSHRTVYGMNAALDQMIKAGLIEVVPASKIHYYRLTPAGKEAAKSLKGTRHEHDSNAVHMH